MLEIYDPFPGVTGTLENCVFCRTETEYWYKPKDVAMCPNCASAALAEEVPDKLDWIIKEQFLDGLC